MINKMFKINTKLCLFIMVQFKDTDQCVSMVLECSELMLLLIGPSSMQKKNFPSTSLAYLTHKCFMLVIFSQYDSVVLSYNCRAFIRLATDGFSILQIVLTSRSIKDIKCHMQKIESLSVILNLNYNSIK